MEFFDRHPEKDGQYKGGDYQRGKEHILSF
jgi:hypothetical protein